MTATQADAARRARDAHVQAVTDLRAAEERMRDAFERMSIASVRRTELTRQVDALRALPADHPDAVGIDKVLVLLEAAKHEVTLAEAGNGRAARQMAAARGKERAAREAADVASQASRKTAQTAEEVFAAAVRAGREKQGWTQPQLAQKLVELHGIDLGQSGIARIESGQRSVRLNEVVALTDVLRLSLKAFAPQTTLKTREEFQQALKQLAELKTWHLHTSNEKARTEQMLASVTTKLESIQHDLAKLEADVQDYREVHGEY